MPWVAPRQASNCQEHTFQETPARYGFNGIARTSRLEAAAWAQKRTHEVAVKEHWRQRYPCRERQADCGFACGLTTRLATRSHNLSRIFAVSWLLSWSLPRRASTIASIAGRWCCLRRKVSRIRRFRRFLSTAERTFFLAITNPSLGCSKVLLVARIR